MQAALSEEDQLIEQAIREAEERYEQETTARRNASKSSTSASGVSPQADGPILPCRYCGTLSIDDKMLKDFGVSVCFPCKLSHREDYKCISKSRAAKEYLLTDDQLSKLRSATVSNPNKVGWQDMRLFLLSHVKREAERKWGSLAEMEEEKKRRVEAKLVQRQNKGKKQKRSLVDPLEQPNPGSSLIENEIKRQRNAAVLGDSDRDPVVRTIPAKQEAIPDVFKARKSTHVHNFGPERPSKKNPGEVVKRCVDCGFRVVSEVF